jgi:hypothetical protein
MELKINLADREEIAAAVPLLQMILAETKPHACTGSGQCHREPDGKLDLSGTQAAGLVAIADPAAVFGGGAAVAVPLPPTVAPSIAGAVPLPIAPEAMTANTSTATPTPAFVPPAPTAPGMVAPTASAAAPTTPANVVELDSKGLPWDERIHAGTKSKLKSGEWKAKKQVEAALVASVEAELRARVAASPAPVAAVQDAAAVFAAAPGVPAVPAPFVPPAAPLAPAAPAAPSVSADPTTFEQLMPRITAAVTAGSIAPTAVGAACAAHGVASVVTLQTNPQFVPLVWATLKQQYPSLA